MAPPLLFLIGLAALPIGAQPDSVTRDVVIGFTAADGTPLEAKLSLPRTATVPVPVVFYLHGAGPRNYDNNVRYRGADGQIRTTSYYGYHARELAALGVAFFRISKRGCSVDSTGRTRVDRAVFSKATPSVLLDDYARALEALRQRTDIDPNRIVLYGSSEGTRVAPQLAKRAPAGLRGLVLTSHQSDNTHDTVVWQNSIGPWRNVRALIPAATEGGLTRAAYDTAVGHDRTIAPQLPFQALDQDSNGVVTPAELARLTKPRLEMILKAIETKNDDFLWRGLLNLSSAYLLDGWQGPPTAALLEEVSLPIAIFHGALDGTTRVEGVVETEARFRAAGKTNLTVKIYPGLNHDLGWTPETAENGGPLALRESMAKAAELLRPQ